MYGIRKRYMSVHKAFENRIIRFTLLSGVDPKIWIHLGVCTNKLMFLGFVVCEQILSFSCNNALRSSVQLISSSFRLFDFTHFQIKSITLSRWSLGYMPAATRCRFMAATPCHSHSCKIYCSPSPVSCLSISRVAMDFANPLAKSPQITLRRGQL